MAFHTMDQFGSECCNAIARTLFGTSKDVCTDNFFTSYNLAKLILQNNLMLLVMTRKHRQEVPGSLNRKMEICSTKFLFNHVNGICLLLTKQR